MAIAWIPLCFLALAAQRLFGIRHTMYSVFSLVHSWNLSQRFVEASFFYPRSISFARAPKIKMAAGEIPRGAHGLRMALAQKMFVGDQLCFEVFHTCLSQRSLLERRWLCVDGWADGAG